MKWKPFRPQVFAGILCMAVMGIASIIAGVTTNSNEPWLVANACAIGLGQLLPKLVEDKDE